MQLSIPRIPIIPTGYPFEFKRIQFAVKLSFFMIINKFQGQSIKHCGLYLENRCFDHGQFYVVASRVGVQKNLKISKFILQVYWSDSHCNCSQTLITTAKLVPTHRGGSFFCMPEI